VIMREGFERRCLVLLRSIVTLEYDAVHTSFRGPRYRVDTCRVPSPSPEYLARHSSPADQLTEFCATAIFRELSVGLEDDAAVASLCEITVFVRLMSSCNSERREASSALSGSAVSAISTWKVGLDRFRGLLCPCVSKRCDVCAMSRIEDGRQP